MALVKGQSYTPAQIYAEDPEWLKANAPSIYSQFTQQVAQPSAGLTGQNLSNTTEASTLPGKAAQSKVAVQTAPGQVAGTDAENKLKVSQADQLSIKNNAGTFFNSKVGHGGDGYVNPKDYNNFLNQFTQAGGDPTEFHKDFANKVNPNNIWYDTPDNVATRGNLGLITNVLKSYQALPQDQVGPKAQEIAGYMSKVPVFGKQYAQNFLAKGIAHDSLLNSQAANIKNIISQQSQGQGGSYPLRNLIELGNMVDILPTSQMDTKTAEAKVTELDNLLQAKFGLNGTQDLYKLFPGGKGY